MSSIPETRLHVLSVYARPAHGSPVRASRAQGGGMTMFQMVVHMNLSSHVYVCIYIYMKIMLLDLYIYIYRPMYVILTSIHV